MEFSARKMLARLRPLPSIDVLDTRDDFVMWPPLKRWLLRRPDHMSDLGHNPEARPMKPVRRRCSRQNSTIADTAWREQCSPDLWRTGLTARLCLSRRYSSLEPPA